MNRKGLFFLALIFCCLIYSEVPAIDLSRKDNKMNKCDIEGDNSPFGVLEFLHWDHAWNNHKYPDEKSLKRSIGLMKKAGVSWVRVDILWSDIEPQPGNFSFEKYDRIINLLSDNHIHALAILHYSTDWASACGKWNCPPKDNALFVNYTVKVIDRYKEKIKFWEIWNEPDSSVYWQPQDGLKSYCALLKEIYVAAKRIDPDCKILNGGLANGLASVNKLYDNGAKDYFDILNIHFFETPVNPKALYAVMAYPKLVRKIMKRNGDAGKNIWITEIGCPGVKSKQPKSPDVSNWWMGSNPDEKQQSQWVKEIYSKLIYSEGVEKVFWAFFRDTKAHWKNGVDYFGLVRWDLSRKPAFLTYKKCVDEWKKKRRSKWVFY